MRRAIGRLGVGPRLQSVAIDHVEGWSDSRGRSLSGGYDHVSTVRLLDRPRRTLMIDTT